VLYAPWIWKRFDKIERITDPVLILWLVFTNIRLIMTRETTKRRQQQIVEAAMDILVSGGMGRLTMQALADRIGITDAAIYKHFSGKSEILIAMLDTVRENLLERMETVVRSERTADAKLQQMLITHLSYIEEEQGRPHVLFSEALYTAGPEMKNGMRSIMQGYRKLLQTVLQEGKEHGEIRTDLNEDAFATVFLGTVQATVTRWALTGFAASPGEEADSLWDILARNLR